MQLSQIISRLHAIAPLEYAESWDNVGLLAGDVTQDVTRATICIDYTQAVADEAKAAGSELVIAYHPPMFKPVTRITSTGSTALIYDAISRGVAIYSPHTAFDVADGGTNDVLADLIGLTDRKPLRKAEPSANQLKLNTFVPREHLDAVAEAMFAAGAGRIGDYSSCSFLSEGIGTFFGNEGSNPTTGVAGKLEKTPEVKLETVVPIEAVSAVIAALRHAHPYEEPAFDLVQLAATPVTRGIGRVGAFAAPIDRKKLIEKLKIGLGIDHLLIAGENDRPIRSAAICAGAGDDLLKDALSQKVDLFLAGELRHRNALLAAQSGMTVICTLHSHSERIALKSLAIRLAELMPQVTWNLAKADRDPFQIL